MNFIIDNPGEYLKERRKNVKLTLREVSELTGLTSGYISRIENGSSFPSLESLYKLSKVLSFNIDEICSFVEIPIEQNEPVDIEDVFRGIPIKIGEDVLGDYEKIQMAKLLQVIHKTDWNDNINKMNHISQILIAIDEIKNKERN